MKKIAYLSILAGLFLVGCTELAQPADPQTNAQEELVTISGAVTATAVPVIDLAKVEGDSVAVATVNTQIAASENADLKYYVTLDKKYEFEVAADMKIPVEELQALVEDVYGKRPTERTFKAVVTVAAVVRGSAILYDSEAFNVVLVPEAPFIDKAYYLVGNMCAVYNEEKGEFEGGWDKPSAKKFNHSGKDVYEDSEFSLIVKLPVDAEGKPSGDSYYWKVIPAGNYESADGFWAEGVTGVVGVEKDGDDAKEGKLVTSSPQAAKINFNKDEESMNLFKITLNMLDYTYKVEELNFVEYIYVPGNHQGWRPATAPALHGANFDGVWTGFSMLDGGFKFTHEREWDKGEYKGSDFATLPKGFTTEGGDITATPKAFYYIKADVTNSKLEATEIKSMGIIGPAQEGGWDKDTDMTWNAEKGAWVVTGITLKADELKFRANDDWGINIGGSFDKLVENGDNIKVEAGTYDIELYLQRTDSNNMYAKMTKK